MKTNGVSFYRLHIYLPYLKCRRVQHIMDRGLTTLVFLLTKFFKNDVRDETVPLDKLSTLLKRGHIYYVIK